MNRRLFPSFFAACLLAWILVLPANATAQKKKTVADASTQLQQLVESSFNTFKTTGLSVAIVKDGQVVMAKGFGSANTESNTPAASGSLTTSPLAAKLSPQPPSACWSRKANFAGKTKSATICLIFRWLILISPLK
ncbi:MAG: hypothetical protein IPP17_10010 [Bacteroidetes bacterium]|nr:hypothetical protein [Bacteroidota bacterium]